MALERQGPLGKAALCPVQAFKAAAHRAGCGQPRPSTVRMPAHVGWQCVGAHQGRTALMSWLLRRRLWPRPCSLPPEHAS